MWNGYGVCSNLLHMTALTTEEARLHSAEFLTSKRLITLYLVDFEIWTTIHGRYNNTDIQIVDELKQRLIQVWCNLDQDVIDTAC